MSIMIITAANVTSEVPFLQHILTGESEHAKVQKWLHGIICTLHMTANWKQSTHSYHSWNQPGNRISLLAVLTEYDRVSTAAGTGMVICQYSVLSFQTRSDNSVLSLWAYRKFVHVFNGEYTLRHPLNTRTHCLRPFKPDCQSLAPLFHTASSPLLHLAPPSNKGTSWDVSLSDV